MNGWEVVGTFVGIPAAVLALIALPIFGPEWWRRHRDRRDQDAHQQADQGRRGVPAASGHRSSVAHSS